MRSCSSVWSAWTAAVGFRSPCRIYSGRYKAPLVEGDDYLLRLSRYIHLNPVRTTALSDMPVEERVKRLRAYRWSSYRAYAGLEPGQEWMDYEPLRALVAVNAPDPMAAYAQFVEAELDADDPVLEKGMGWSSKAIGEREFCGQIELELKAQAAALGSPQDAGECCGFETRQDTVSR